MLNTGGKDMSQNQIPSSNPNSFFVWIEGYGVEKIITPEEYKEEWIRADMDPLLMRDLLEQVFPQWREVQGVEEIKRVGDRVEVKYRYIEDGEERTGHVYIVYDLDEIDEHAGYWNEVIESLENEGIPRNNVVKAWRLERIIYEVKGINRVYYDDPSIVVIVEVRW